MTSAMFIPSSTVFKLMPETTRACCRWTRNVHWPGKRLCSHCDVHVLFRHSHVAGVQEEFVVEKVHNSAATGKVIPLRKTQKKITNTLTTQTPDILYRVV